MEAEIRRTDKTEPPRDLVEKQDLRDRAVEDLAKGAPTLVKDAQGGETRQSLVGMNSRWEGVDTVEPQNESQE